MHRFLQSSSTVVWHDMVSGFLETVSNARGATLEISARRLNGHPTHTSHVETYYGRCSRCFLAHLLVWNKHQMLRLWQCWFVFLFANDGLFHSSSSCMTLEFQMAAARLEAFRSRCCCLMFVVNLMIEISSEKSSRGVLWFLLRRCTSCFQNFIFLKFKYWNGQTGDTLARHEWQSITLTMLVLSRVVG